jgi:hypothetical protein
MPNTPVYTTGVKYIKIAKQDSGNVDNSIELQNLTDIRIKFSDINNAVQYNVTSIAEYSTYYLYSIFPLNITSSADQEILDYKVSGSASTLTPVPISPFIYLLSSWTVPINTLNYFNSSTGKYTLGNTPNIALNFTHSFNINCPTPITFFFATVASNNDPQTIYFGDIFYPASGVISDTISGSFTPIEGEAYAFFIFTTSPTSIVSSNFLITQSFAPEASNLDIVVLEPYSGYNFYNSDCNVIQNNVDTNNISELFMDVDFNEGQIVAQNQAAILSGNASRAQVQPWNYSYYSQISGRYIGKQQNAINLNTYTGPTTYTNGTSSIYGYTGSWPGDSTSPGVIVPGNIVIQWLDSCIYEMNYGGPGYPENVNGGGISMGNIYLVGETRDDVATIKPGTDIYYDILEKTFPSGSPAFQYQYVNPSTLSNQLNITYPSLILPSANYYFSSGADPNDLAGIFSTLTAGYFYPQGDPNLNSLNPFLLLNFPPLLGIWDAYINQNGSLAQLNSTPNGNANMLSVTLPIISSSLSQGEKWFLSLYSGSGDANNPSTGLPTVVSGNIDISQYGYPFEIEAAYITSSLQYGFITLKSGSGVHDVASFFSGSSPIFVGRSGSVATTGFLITKAQYPSNGLTIFGPPNSNFAGAGQGYILSQYPKKVITENLDYILKTYGNKP